ncbi:MAG: hypothetical protein ACFE9S_15345 [Candidatus Hermodarchaeota archaeon]
MSQTLKKSTIKAHDIDEYYAKYFKDPKAFHPIVLDYLFRNVTFASNNDRIRAITASEYNQICEATNVPQIIVHRIISCFLVDLIRVRKFFKENAKVFSSRHQARKVRIYLHKLHRLAPVFDYKRARENARRLEIKLSQLCFRPQIMTQVAIVIFITDLLDKRSRVHYKIIQSNLRTFCNCSAYAFHRTRNKLGLTATYIRNLRIN